MKKFLTILSIVTLSSALLVFAGCSTDNNSSSISEPKEPTVTVSQSVSFSFKATSSTKATTKPSTTKKTTKPYTQPTTKYVAPTTQYVAPTTQYVAPTTQYVAPTTKYVAPTTKYVAPSSNRLTASEVSKMSKTEIQNKINDIYASYGYIFKTKSIQAYYESQSWYVPRYTSETTVESLFSADDNYNKNLLAQYR